MKNLLSRLASVAALALVMVALPGWAAPGLLGPGDTLPRLELADQHDKPVTIDGSTHVLIFAADKAGSELAQAVLEAQDAGVLARLHAVYVADISAMPGIITTMFALPKLRELPFAVALVQDAAQTARLPRQPGQVTVLRLEGDLVRQIQFVVDANGLRRALGL